MIVLKGFGIFYLEDGQVKSINYDLIWADNTKQNAKATVRGFRMLREQEFFKRISNGKNTYIIWTDAGKHFKCNEVASYFMKELAQEKIHGN